MEKLTKESPATGVELHTIAKLCRVLRINEYLEERKLTHGEAGELIRKLSLQIKIMRNKEKKNANIIPRYSNKK